MPSFLDLPAELRNRIYHLVFEDKCIIICTKSHYAWKWDQSQWGQTSIYREPSYRGNQTTFALAQMSRQTRLDTIPIYYGKNIIVLDGNVISTQYAQLWAMSVGPHTSHIRRLWLIGTARSQHQGDCLWIALSISFMIKFEQSGYTLESNGGEGCTCGDISIANVKAQLEFNRVNGELMVTPELICRMYMAFRLPYPLRCPDEIEFQEWKRRNVADVH